MKVTVLPDPRGALSALGELFEWADGVDLTYAWATSGEGTAEHWGAIDLEKLRRVVIGTQFAQTEPWALSALRDNSDLFRVVITSEGTFHPKLALGKKAHRFRALLGSSNLTVAGFSTNFELNLLLEGELSDPQAEYLERVVCDAIKNGVELKDDWLIRYADAYRRRPKSTGLVPAAPIEGESLQSLDIPWSRYAEVVLGSAGSLLKNGTRLRLFEPQNSYFWELERAQASFRQFPNFLAMPAEDRRFIFGQGQTSGYFGHMGRALGTAAALIERPEELAEAVDCIPLEGAIGPELASKLIRKLIGISGIGLAVASRVLCIKRPDTFVPLNNANREAFERMGYRAGHDVEHYLALLNRIWNTEWYRAEKPRGAQGTWLWHARAAILDAAIYRG